MNQGSLTALPISRLKCFQEHISCEKVCDPGAMLKSDEAKPSTGQIALT